MSASVHWRTPVMAVSDPRGLSIRQVDYLRTTAGETAEALVTRQLHNVAGRPVEQRDPRLSRANSVHIYCLDGTTPSVASVDAGWRLSLPGLAGEILQRWDERGHHWRMTYDPRLRLTTARESAQPDPETFTYADASSDAGFNLRGQLLEQVDPSGSLLFESFALTGEALGETRTFHDGKAFSSHRTYSPLSAVLEQTDAGGHRQQSRYDLAGQLTQAQLQLKGQTTWQAVLREAQYDAAGQIIEQKAGNGVTRRWRYDPASLRLQRQSAQLDQLPPLQDFEYEYDPVGNITRILDNLFTPRHFANQRVDGHREFSYDSLYRLHTASGYDDAAPSDIPGLPQPTDPADRRNYTQTYTYDHGGNLTGLRHVRDGASYTRRLRIDPASNRGVRWNEGDPEPDFASLFDRHGNLLAVQPGQPLQWNPHDELARATLVQRDSGPDDAEQYRYSAGARVYKRLDTDANRHFQEVRYLPGLEIRSKDNGEELHIVVLPTGVRCLHWAAQPPVGIDQDQLRYTLEDHLGSCLMEIDQQARMIAHEGYYPFGATAWMAARSQIEVDYKFVRYSGKEMDVSGLYYYGARYYAPWLQRWVSADPSGDVDGLNQYAFVGNNPLRYVDPSGGSRAEATIMLYAGFLAQVSGYSEQTNAQLHNIIHQKGFKGALLSNVVVEGIKGPIGYEAGLIGGTQIDMAAPHGRTLPPHLTTGGLIGGNIGGDVSGAKVDVPLNAAGFTGGGMIPKTSKMSVAAIDHDLGIRQAVGEIRNFRDFMNERGTPALNKVLNPEFMMNRVMATWISIIPGAINMFALAFEIEDIKNRLDPVKIGKIETMLSDWQTALEERSAWMENAFDALGKEVLYPADVLPNVNNMTTKEMLAPITRSGLRQQTAATRYEIAHAQRGLAAYKEMGTTDNQFLRRMAHPPKQRSSNWFTRST